MSDLQVKLSTGEKVTFKPYFTRQVSRAYNEKLYDGLDWIPDPENPKKLKPSGNPIINGDRAWEAAMEFMIEKIEDAKGGNTQVSAAWVDGLREGDYSLIRDKLIDIKNAQIPKYEEAEKKLTKSKRRYHQE